MSCRQPHYVYVEETKDPGGAFEVCGLALCLGGIVLIWAWPYIGPVFYTVIYILDIAARLFDPSWPVIWRGDASAYTVGLAGLTAAVLAVGTFYGVRRVWRFARSFLRD